MSLYKTDGIVLKTYKLGEADKIVTFLTGNHGKVRAVAKGVRKTKSKFGSRLEPFSHVDLLLYAGRSDLHTVAQAELITPFKEIREDFERVTFGSGMLDLAEKASVEGEADHTLFELLRKTLEALAGAERGHRSLLAAFDLKLMSVIGYRPKLSSCAICGIQPRVLGRFSNDRGGAVCEGCFEATGVGAPIKPVVLSAMAVLLGTKLAEIAGERRYEDEVAAVVEEYVDYHLQSRLRSRECLNDIERVQPR
ncbi:MAG: DNA repair protein RecO [Candidatus Aquicultorales bacterium]